MNIEPSKLDAHALSAYADNAHKLTAAASAASSSISSRPLSFDALARNDVLQVLFFAILFGVSLALVGEPGEAGRRLIEMRLEGAVPRHGPDRPPRAAGRAGRGRPTRSASTASARLSSLPRWSRVLALGRAASSLVVLGVVMRVSGLNILRFLSYLREELTIVLATASSDACCRRSCAS